MMKTGSNADADTSPGDTKEVNRAAKRSSIQKCIQALAHACRCSDSECRYFKCLLMKKVMNHAKMCKLKSKGNCHSCKKLILLCCYHAKNCSETQKCWVPFCSKIKRRIKLDHQRKAAAMPQPAAAMQQPHILSHDEQKALQQQHQKAMQQLIATLRMPSGVRQAVEILRILNSNPPLMAAFVRLRQNSLRE